MRYRVRGFEVRSENAAKPRAQRSRYLERELRNSSSAHQVLDYGCGKLRYFSVLRNLGEYLTVVDSKLQLERSQVIGGRKTNVREYVLRWPQVRALDLDEFAKDRTTFDTLLCSNVLSAIPSYKVRLAVVSLLAKRTSAPGHALFVLQYRNSHYTALRDNPNAEPYLDGYLVHTRQGSHFYGLISPEKLTELLARGGFQVDRMWKNDGSAYAWASRKQRA